MDESISLYRRAVQSCPDNISYSLNLVHTLELEYDYEAALDEIRRFCRDNPDHEVGGISCSRFQRTVLDHIDGNIFDQRFMSTAGCAGCSRDVCRRPRGPATETEDCLASESTGCCGRGGPRHRDDPECGSYLAEEPATVARGPKEGWWTYSSVDR